MVILVLNCGSSSIKYQVAKADMRFMDSSKRAELVFPVLPIFDLLCYRNFHACQFLNLYIIKTPHFKISSLSNF